MVFPINPNINILSSSKSWNINLYFDSVVLTSFHNIGKKRMSKKKKLPSCLKLCHETWGIMPGWQFHPLSRDENDTMSISPSPDCPQHLQPLPRVLCNSALCYIVFLYGDFLSFPVLTALTWGNCGLNHSEALVSSLIKWGQCYFIHGLWGLSTICMIITSLQSNMLMNKN